MELPKTGNTIWFNRAFLYYHKCDNDPKFVEEMYWIMRELGILSPKQE